MYNILKINRYRVKNKFEHNFIFYLLSFFFLNFNKITKKWKKKKHSSKNIFKNNITSWQIKILFVKKNANYTCTYLHCSCHSCTKMCNIVWKKFCKPKTPYFRLQISVKNYITGLHVPLDDMWFSFLMKKLRLFLTSLTRHELIWILISGP